MSISVKIFNFFRARASNHRLFKGFCEEMESEHELVLYYTKGSLAVKGASLEVPVLGASRSVSILKDKVNILHEYLEREDFFTRTSVLSRYSFSFERK